MSNKNKNKQHRNISQVHKRRASDREKIRQALQDLRDEIYSPAIQLEIPFPEQNFKSSR